MRCEHFLCFECFPKVPAHFLKSVFGIFLLVLFYIFTRKDVGLKNFDYFILSQRWLPTACVEYIEHHSSSSNQSQCIMPKNSNVWVIHGLWPTLNDHMGPFFCNKSMAFNFTQLKTIVPKLEIKWPNIERGKSVESLWEHEWNKHGTCAAQLKSFDTELKYFNITLSLFETYNIQRVVNRNNILPNRRINVTQILHIIKNAFGKLPQIHCIHEVKTKLSYLSEIRLCFNKNLDLMDCGNIISDKMNINPYMGHITDCSIAKEIIYPDFNLHKFSLVIPSKRDYYGSLTNILDIIRYLQWAFI